jgi:xanthine/uracil permease
VARGRGSIAREAARTAAYMAAFGLIAYFGMKAVIKIEATKTRLFLVIVIFGVGFGAAALLDHLRQRLGKTSRCLEGRRA